MGPALTSCVWFLRLVCWRPVFDECLLLLTVEAPDCPFCRAKILLYHCLGQLYSIIIILFKGSLAAAMEHAL